MNDRISRQQMLMGMAEVAARRSTCARSQVGVVIALDSRPLVSGYNGAPAGMPHCDHTCTCLPNIIRGGESMIWRAQLHEIGCPAGDPCDIAVHAEANAIAFAARHGVKLEGSTLFVTLSPCVPCAKLIINAGIVEVVYSTVYRDDAGIGLLNTAGVKAWLQAG